MGCSSCSNGGGTPAGCRNNGTCGTYGCNNLDVFDWLADVAVPEGYNPCNIVEVRFKGPRKVLLQKRLPESNCRLATW